jgi:hypothetical protein
MIHACFGMETGASVTLQAVGGENGAFLTDADPNSACFGCPVVQTDFNSFQYAQGVSTDLGVSLVSSGIPVGQGDPRPFGVSPQTTQMVCCFVWAMRSQCGASGKMTCGTKDIYSRPSACAGAGIIPDINDS